ncbi:hypothetical protein K437DRAFT_254293 [Tilletiaria anomala UBC 951]|uniref:Uncharacterized protein n=1 Tax=Tilletiaria anomala (strain ATCC 24038 / CBS 436.72 / UBC 951) TaxID=1037660 RepID=A0A066WIF9_TILAU|nr:uncharacterized protein K437DRAFT_254293 [Tilletiaria anomala UBC 951]KDN52308.1 hypothetical protein K437DRAFT_254293 [Tilletiaria anomala UBC 951]
MATDDWNPFPEVIRPPLMSTCHVASTEERDHVFFHETLLSAECHHTWNNFCRCHVRDQITGQRDAVGRARQSMRHPSEVGYRSLYLSPCCIDLESNQLEQPDGGMPMPMSVSCFYPWYEPTCNKETRLSSTNCCRLPKNLSMEPMRRRVEEDNAFVEPSLYDETANLYRRLALLAVGDIGAEKACELCRLPMLMLNYLLQQAWSLTL